MQSFQVWHPDNSVETIHSLLESLGRPQIIPSRKGMAGINTYANTSLVIYKGDDVSQMFPGGSDNIATTSHVLQDRYNGFGCLVRLVQLLGNPLDRFRSGMTTTTARMKVVKPNAKLLTALKIV